ncbi:MAG: ribonuclease III [Desulfovibrio sp.]|nr:ribonuclease III [Desulfovibrio sp.]
MENHAPQTHNDLQSIEACLGYTFTNPKLLEQALTHSSYANEMVDTPIEHNERMEFLGDAVLELCISHLCFHTYPSLREGALTKIRSALVSAQGLAAVARSLTLDRFIKLGHGEEMQGGRNRDSILSDTFEAVLAAIYVDAGFAKALEIATAIFAPSLPKPEEVLAFHKDNKTLLQEMVQQRFKAVPSYALIGSVGPEHAKIFTITLTLPDGTNFTAEGSSFKRAEQEAAGRALAYFSKQYGR